MNLGDEEEIHVVRPVEYPAPLTVEEPQVPIRREAPVPVPEQAPVEDE